SNEAVMLLEFNTRIASTASARSSPATNRRVILLNDLKLFRKLLSLSLFERYSRVDLSIAGWPVSRLDSSLGRRQHHHGPHRLRVNTVDRNRISPKSRSISDRAARVNPRVIGFQPITRDYTRLTAVDGPNRIEVNK